MRFAFYAHSKPFSTTSINCFLPRTFRNAIVIDTAHFYSGAPCNNLNKLIVPFKELFLSRPPLLITVEVYIFFPESGSFNKLYRCFGWYRGPFTLELNYCVNGLRHTWNELMNRSVPSSFACDTRNCGNLKLRQIVSQFSWNLFCWSTAFYAHPRWQVCVWESTAWCVYEPANPHWGLSG